MVEHGPVLLEAEVSPEQRAEACLELQQAGLRLVQERYGEGSSIERLPFHGPEHTEAVMERTGQILEDLRSVNPDGVTEEDAAFGRMAAAWHDTEMRSRENPTTGLRDRFRGFYEGDNPNLPSGERGNEGASAEALVESMRAAVDADGGAIFSDADVARAERAVAATFPAFAFEEFPPEEKARVPGGPEKGLKIYQPHLEAGLREGRVDRVALALGLADLSYFGYEDDPRVSLAHAKEEFREIHLELNNLDALTPEQRGKAAKDILSFMDGQTGFIRWQRVRFEQLIQPLFPVEQQRLRERFPEENWNWSLAEAQRYAQTLHAKYDAAAVAGDREQFEVLAREMGYGR